MTYTPFVFFGYEILIDPEMDLRSSIAMMYDLNGMIPSPYQIRCILTSFYPDMNEEEHANIVIGFDPEHDQILDQAADLKAFISDTLLLDGLEVSENPHFHCGIEWHPEPESEVESDSESESEIDSDYESDYETESESDY